jgi:branched-chain amino acid transport system substrate-binding protein
MLAGCSAPPTGGSTPTSSGFEGTYTIYATLGETGAAAAIAKANVEAIKVAIDAVNAEGGIAHRKVELVLADNAGDPSKALTLLQQQLDSTKPDLVIAGNSSNIALAMTPVLTREEIISTGQTAAVTDSTLYPYHFSFQPSIPLFVQGVVDRMKQQGYKKVALLVGNDATGTFYSGLYKTAFGEAGITLVQQQYSPTDIDMTAQLQQLQAQNPEALVFYGLGAPAGYILKSRTKLGWNIPTVGDVSVGSTDLSSITTSADWKNLDVEVPAVVASTTPRSAGFKDLVSRLKKSGSTLQQSMQQYAVMWDIVHLAKYVWEHAKSDKSIDIKNEYEKVDIEVGSKGVFVSFPTIKIAKATHILITTAKETAAFVKPGPFVDGVIEPK